MHVQVIARRQMLQLILLVSIIDTTNIDTCHPDHRAHIPVIQRHLCRIHLNRTRIRDHDLHFQLSLFMVTMKRLAQTDSVEVCQVFVD